MYSLFWAVSTDHAYVTEKGKKETTKMSSLPPPQFSNIEEDSSTKRWIHVTNFDEGISGWRESLAETLYLAFLYNASLVEPCMMAGRLLSCSKVPSNHRVFLSQIIDFVPLQNTYGARIIAPYKKFDEEVNASNVSSSVFVVCFPAHPEPLPQCDNFGNYDASSRTGIPFNYTESPEIIRWSQNSFDVQKNIGPEILEIRTIRRKKLNLSLPIGSFFFFRQHHWDIVDYTLRKGLSNAEHGFSIVHWRGEQNGMNYTLCAEYILDIIMQRDNDLPFFLMSSLKNERKNMWGGAKRLADTAGSDPQKALDLLLRNDTMITFDSLLNEAGIVPADSGLLAVWELILVSRASEFITCIRGCEQRCGECNYAGKFSTMATEYFGTRRSHLHKCWPNQQQQ